MSKLLFCTDLDRTLLPNGREPESPGARERFACLVEHEGIVLVYVTGRHLASVEKAIEGYGLPLPDYVICDVGTTIYRRRGADGGSRTAVMPEGGGNPGPTVEWRQLESWYHRLHELWPGDQPTTARTLLARLPGLELQEPERQGGFKSSFYTPGDKDPAALLERVRERLEGRGIEAALIHSVDENSGRGLLDVLPAGAGKRAAVEHLLETESIPTDSAFFAGDSGNDLEVLVSPIPSVLVANAPAELRERARAEAARNGNARALYLAEGDFHGMNGNYAAGILEGLTHFEPESLEWWT